MKTKTQTIFMHMEIKSSHFADFSMSVKIMHELRMWKLEVQKEM